MKNPVEVWVCLEPLGRVGLWYLKREDAEKTLGTFTTIVPVMLPWELYSGIAAGAPVEDAYPGGEDQRVFDEIERGDDDGSF